MHQNKHNIYLLYCCSFLFLNIKKSRMHTIFLEIRMFGDRNMNNSLFKKLKNFFKEKALLKKIKQGFKNYEFKMHIQFIVDNKTKKIVSGEALSRWENSSGKVIFPGAYIGLMEKSGLIVKFDYYMFVLMQDHIYHKYNILNIQNLLKVLRIYILFDLPY